MIATRFVITLLLCPQLVSGQGHDHRSGPAEKLGTVHFPTSCAAAAQPAFDRGVALLHSFEFRSAIDAFSDSLKTDPSCAMAHWGIALSQWGNPFAAGNRSATLMTQGLSAIDAAGKTATATARERDYIAAAAHLYANADTRDQLARITAYRDAMAGVASKYADDTEAAIFYALAVAASADPADKTYANLLKAGEILERLVARQPEHPGLAHYIIHSYDVPPLASRALEAARRYSTIAPAAPHALHMPSHTFTRVGY